jgi:glycerol-3-phosphate dehydrogenase
MLTLDQRYREAPVLTVYGGKITTARRLAEEAMSRIGQFFQLRPRWTAGSTLPGGDFEPDEFDQQVLRARNRWTFLDEAQAHRMVKAYGTRIERILGGATSKPDLGQEFAGGVTEAEVRYLIEHEWAQTAEDILWRRGKSGLMASREEAEALDRFLRENAA